MFQQTIICFTFIVLLLLVPHYCSTQTYVGNFSHLSITPKSVTLHATTGSVRCIFYRADIVRIDYLPDTSTVPDSSFVVVQDISDAIFPTISEDDTSVSLTTSAIKVSCTKYPLRLSFYSSSNKLLLAELKAGGLSNTGVERKANFILQPDDHFYGTGERANSLDKRGLLLGSYNTQIGGYSTPLPMMNANIPFLASSRGYALYFDNTYRGQYDLGNSSSDRFSYKAYGGELTYYFIAGETIPLQLEAYTWLTGRQPLPPKWALGFIQSKYGYRNEAEARSMVDTMRLKQIPCDAIILDLYWFQYMGDISWYLPNWPQPFQMMSDFRARGIKTMVITEPYIAKPSLNYAPAVGQGFVGRTSGNQPYTITNWWSCRCDAYLLDLTNPSAQQWWWNLHPTFFGNDLAGIWTDLCEPENHPDSMKHYLGGTPKVHNIFNLLWAKTIWDGVSQLRPNQRFFNLTRSGFAGIQRYGVSIWSGDVGRSFGGLAVQLPMLLNMGMSGIGYHNSDIGGFGNGTTTAELYTRWMQYGTFCPITRAHGVGQPTEPWSYGPETEAICKKYIELRYQLLPYIYTMAYENNKSGMPLARPLFFDYPNDANLSNESSSYMWGSKFLVSPVVQAGQTTKPVYLPQGKWIDFWADSEIEGGQTITASAPIETLPLYVKAGSIIPMQFVMNYTDERPLDTIRLACYPSQEETGLFALYEDDGKTYDYTTGNFAQTEFTQRIENIGTDTALVLNIGASNGTYTGKPLARTYIPEIHRMLTKPLAVRKNGTLLSEDSSYLALRQDGEGYFFDSTTHILYIQVSTLPDSSYEIKADNIRFVGVQDNQEEIPSKSFRLEQNYPNPFNPETVIRYHLNVNSYVSLSIYNLLGEEITTLLSEKKPAGAYQIVWNAANYPSGLYFCKLQTDRHSDIKKLLVVK